MEEITDKVLGHDSLKGMQNDPVENNPWYYPDMSREEASKLLSKYLKVDGVFLVRTSSRDPSGYVLSFVYNNKVVHCMIKQIEADDTIFLSLDYGKTRFYGLQQLIEFYQLNTTCLPTKLTHFLVHNHNSLYCSASD